MADFFKITDATLRDLVMASPAVATLDENRQVAFVEKLISAAPDVIANVRAILEKEQHDVAEARHSELAAVKRQIEQLNQLMEEFQAIERNYKNTVLKFSESGARAEDEKVAEQLLQQLNAT